MQTIVDKINEWNLNNSGSLFKNRQFTEIIDQSNGLIDEDYIRNLNENTEHIYIATEITLTSDLTIPTGLEITFLGEGKFSGAYTVTFQGNQLNGNSQIFNSDITVTGIIKNDRIIPQWWGAVGDDSNDDSIPINKAVQFAIDNGKNKGSYTVYLKNGFYRIYSPIILARLKETTGFDNINIQLIGESKGYDYGTIIQPYYYDKPAILAQACRSLKIKGFNIKGRGNYYQELYDYDTLTDETLYENTDLRDDQYSPYCGISIDPFASSTPELNQYDGYGTYYTGTNGSSNTIIEECRFIHFVVGVMLSSSGYTQLNDSVIISACSFQTNKVCVASGQDQVRGLYIEHIHVNACEVVADCLRYGAKTGASLQIDGAVITHARWLALFNLRRGVAIMTNVYAESFHSIGISPNTSTRKAYNLIFDGCQFKFINPFSGYKTTGTQLILQNTNAIFNNCAFGSYTGDSHSMTFADIDNVGGNCEFNKCTLDGLIWAENIEMKYNDCNFYYAELIGMNKAGTGNVLNEITDTLPGNLLSSPTKTWQAVPIDADPVDNEDGTVTITNADGNFTLGDKILIKAQLKNYDYSLELATYICGRVTQYSGGNYTVSGLVPDLILDSDVYVLCRVKELNPRSFGNFDTSGNVITNVTDIDTFALKEIIIDPGNSGRYLRIIDIDTDNDTLTIHKNGSNTGVYNGVEIIRSRNPESKTTEGTAAPTSGSYFKGDYVTNTDIVDIGGGVYVKGWLCVAGGQPGTWITENF